MIQLPNPFYCLDATKITKITETLEYSLERHGYPEKPWQYLGVKPRRDIERYWETETPHFSLKTYGDDEIQEQLRADYNRLANQLYEYSGIRIP